MPLTPDDVEGLQILGYHVAMWESGQWRWSYRGGSRPEVKIWSTPDHAAAADAWESAFAHAVEQNIVTPIDSHDSAQESDANN